MRLNAQQVASVKSELDADPLEEENPGIGALRKTFGDHTFYVFMDGLYIVEPVDASPPPIPTGRMIQVAAWTDDTRKALKPIDPDPSDTVVDLTIGSKKGKKRV